MNFAALLCGALGIGAPLIAQELSTGPITLDLDPSGEGTLRLVAAYEPDPVAPVVRDEANNAVQMAALQTPSGMPQPSIIVGRIAPGQEASFGIDTLLPETIAAFAFQPDDLEARFALRDSNPGLYQKIVLGGHVDPPANELVEVLQTEMKRMNCYRSTIDGDWGPGSRRSVPEYFEALGGDTRWNGDEATVELYRAILLNGDVRCETPVAAAPAPRPAATTTTRTRSTTSTQTRTTTSRRTPAATKPQPTPQRKRRIGGGGTITR